MSKKGKKNHPVYELLTEIIKLEETFKNGIQKNFEGYLIKKSIFDGTKGRIYYQDWKKYIEGKNNYPTFDKVKKEIKSKIESTTIKIVEPIEFKESKELINDISATNSEYYIINRIIGCKIFKNQNEEEHKNKQIFIKIIDNNIIIGLKENDFAIFKNNGLGIIGKSNLFINVYKQHLEILIRIFIFQNEKGKNIINSNTDLC